MDELIVYTHIFLGPRCTIKVNTYKYDVHVTHFSDRGNQIREIPVPAPLRREARKLVGTASFLFV